MPLLLPPHHPLATLSVSAHDAGDRTRLRIGIVNIMPQLESYEVSLLAPLQLAGCLVEPVFVRLESHAYQSSDHQHLDRFYRRFDTIVNERSLDGLVITGAPVEELAFEAVHYWRELEQILGHARVNVAATLGLCWGGLALGRVLGVEKIRFAKKLLGVFEEQRLVAPNDLLPSESGSFVCAHSRHSGFAPDSLAHAERRGAVRLLSHGAATGHSLFESQDGRFIGHLGHPEYEGERLAFEWNRDRSLQRTDVASPENFDVGRPTTKWRTHREALFKGFVARAALSASAKSPGSADVRQLALNV